MKDLQISDFRRYLMETAGIEPARPSPRGGRLKSLQIAGKLVTQLYGHPDAAVARRLIREAHSGAGRVAPLRVVDRTASA